MILQLRENSFFAICFGLFAIVFLALSFHFAAHLNDSEHALQECPVCCLVKIISGVVFLAFIFFLQVSRCHFVFHEQTVPPKIFFVSHLFGRAPPSLLV